MRGLNDVPMTAQASTRGQLPISRFAPSPTGRLHLGHAFSAVLAHDLAVAGGGRFLLRIEDIDTVRCTAAFAAEILRDLEWLGLKWAEAPLVQSTRAAAYGAALDDLRARGLVYRCICTRAEIAASAPHGGIPAVYPGTCRNTPVSADDPRAACWRLDMAAAIACAGPLLWTDGAAGTVIARPGLWGDVVIARKDALASYHLAATIDDAAQGITDVVRGKDLFEATHIHRLLQALFGLPTPRHHHHDLVCGGDGHRLAKRTPGATLADLRGQGVDPRQLVDDLRACRLPIGFTLSAP